ncbi:immunity protein Imm33 domain-containing protein [Chryseobacterium indologenes]|uniref:immunity protein Imm33 domain-containing protein n=1 Tax=Chryseobacterium indologenes TaxID=253 RepID=UPI00405844B6
MIVHREIAIKSNDIYIYTEGLAPIIEKEIRLNIGKENEKDYIEVIKYIIDYVVNENQIISDNQTIAYYSWALQFKIQDNSYLELFEISENGDNFNKGCDLTISIIRSQSEICSQCELIPVFPNFSQQIVISKGVYEGKDIEGIRYESPEHMSGWWLITDDYDDNIESLMTVHYYHVAFKRPDILKYLALPYGYRFLMGNGNIQITKDEDE